MAVPAHDVASRLCGEPDVRHEGGDSYVVDGPFIEAKEHIGGFAVVEGRSVSKLTDLLQELVPIEVRRLLDDFAVDDVVNEDDLLRDRSASGCDALSGRKGQFPIVLRNVAPFRDDIVAIDKLMQHLGMSAVVRSQERPKHLAGGISALGMDPAGTADHDGVRVSRDGSSIHSHASIGFPNDELFG
jgi:hypothetical protein